MVTFAPYLKVSPLSFRPGRILELPYLLSESAYKQADQKQFAA